MRTSKDEYIFPNGIILNFSQDEKVPKEARIYNGYDYKNQYWVYKGERDTRTIEELKRNIYRKK